MENFPQDITLEEAHALVSSLMKTISLSKQSSEKLSLSDTINRVLAEDVISPIDVPAQDTSAVDGYAFYYEDLMKPLPILGSIKAGHPYQEVASAGYAYRIFTGAPMPEGPDTVAMQEHCTFDDQGNVILPDNLKQGTNYRPCGENVSKNEIILKQGQRIGPAEIGLAAAVGRTSLVVKKKLKIALISMGDEVCEIGSPQGYEQGMIFDSNRPMLQSMLHHMGHEIIDFGLVKDDLETLTSIFREAAKQADVIVTSGGSSEGEEDHTKAAILECDGVIDFWRLALKPGRPMVSGRIDQSPLFGLPGNPVAAFVCTRLFIEPMLMIMQGASGHLPPKLSAPSGFNKRHRKGRAEFLRARLEQGPEGLQIVINGKPGAGVLSSLTGADGLVEIPSDHDDVMEGDMLPFLTFREAGL